MIKELSNLTLLQFHLVTESKKVTSITILLHFFQLKNGKNIRNFIVSVIKVLTVPGVTRIMGVIDVWGYGSYEGYGSYRRKWAVLEGYLRVMCVQSYSLINFLPIRM